ncbi:MAG: type II TA system antitoxin MqsA family protein [Chloroflexia bacterium]
MRAQTHTCTNCNKPSPLVTVNYRYKESGLSNVVLQGLQTSNCPHCGNEDVLIPRMEKIHRAIAQALANSPSRLNGEQLRFLRNHLGFTGDKLGAYLHTDRTKISKWERGEDRMGPTTDRLLRLIVAILDTEIRPAVSSIAEHLPLISDDTVTHWELHIDPTTLQSSFLAVSQAA